MWEDQDLEGLKKELIRIGTREKLASVSGVLPYLADVVNRENTF
jgi:hypothetical protein